MGLVWVFLHIRVNVGKCRIFKNTGKKQFSSFSESLKKGRKLLIDKVSGLAEARAEYEKI